MPTYVAELHKLSIHCDFGDTLNERLRDQLVWGMNNQRVQRSLLAVPELTFSKTLDIAQNAEWNAKQLVPNGLHAGKRGVELAFCEASSSQDTGDHGMLPLHMETPSNS